MTNSAKAIFLVLNMVQITNLQYETIYIDSDNQKYSIAEIPELFLATSCRKCVQNF